MNADSEQASAGPNADLIVEAGCVVTVDAERRVLLDAAIAIRGTDIAAVGPRTEIGRVYTAARTIALPNAIATPGLIDAHTHPIDSLISGLCDDTPQVTRLRERVIPYEDGLDRDDAFVAAKISFIEMIRSGTTAFVDGAGPQPDAVAEAALDTGIRGVVTRKLTDVPGPFGGRVQPLGQALADAEETVERWQGAGGGLLRAAYDIDMPLVASDELMAAVAERARDRGVGVVSHLIGRRAPGEGAQPRNPDLARLERAGLLGPGLLLAHIGWVPENDVRLLAESGANIAHCPGSSFVGGNGWVAHGVIPDLVAAGANVALGTDAAIISRSLDLTRAMYLAACGHKDARQDPLIMGPHEVFEMATVNGARASGWGDRIGSIEAGRAADIAIFDASGPGWWPVPLGNPVPDLVYGGSGRDAHTVIVDGVVLLEDGRFPGEDLDALAREAAGASRRAYERLGIAPAPGWPARRA